MPSWLVVVCICLVVPAVLQSSYWLNNRYLGPWWQRGIPTRKASRGLLEVGFSSILPDEAQYEMDGPASAVALLGILEGYTVEISSDYLDDWRMSPFYRVRVFFSTDHLAREALLARRENVLSYSKFFRWNDSIKLTVNHVKRNVVISRAGPPSSQFLLAMAKELIAELKTLGLKPVGYVEGIEQWRINQD